MCINLLPSFCVQDLLNALHLAVCGGHFEVVKYLLPMFGPCKFDFDNLAQTCLHKAAREGHPKILRFLIEEHEFDPSLRDQVTADLKTCHFHLSECQWNEPFVP